VILLDTSVLSAALRRRSPGPAESRVTEALSNLLSTGERVGVPGLVLQELLSGIRETAQFDKIKAVILHGYPIVLAEIQDHLLAAAIVNGCARKGVAISSVDGLLAAIAVNRKASLFTTDRDFARVSRLFPLRLFTTPKGRQESP
jgi:predicted nucleic acid-binding protein